MSKMSVLIVDDNDVDRYILKRMLGALECDIDINEETDGQKAIEFLSRVDNASTDSAIQQPPSVIFLDVNMPLMDGYEFLEAFKNLRESRPLKESVVMMFTSSAREDDHERAFAYEFVKAFLIKGEFTTEDLIKLINERTS